VVKWQFQSTHRPNRAFGFSLVEILLTMALLGIVSLSITNMLIKGSAYSATTGARYQEAMEVQAVILDIMQDLEKGVYISPNSHKQRLEYTTYNTAGSAVKKIYGICYHPADAPSSYTTCRENAGSNTTPFLKLSLDGGSTWGSPYRLAAFNKYRFSGTPLFLYAHDANNCTSFTDTDTNGVWRSGTDAAGVAADCGSFDTSNPILSSPTQTTKVVLSGWQFTTGKGVPEATRNLPGNIFMAAPQGLVTSYSSAVSPGVKDSPLVKSFDTKTANSLFGASFLVTTVLWDPVRQRLLVAGTDMTSFRGKLFQVDRTGVLIGSPLDLSSSAIFQPVGIGLLEDGVTVMILDYTAEAINWYNLNSSSSVRPFKTLALSNPSTGSPALSGTSDLVNLPRGMLYDPRYPDEVFIHGMDPVDSAFKIFEISTTTGSYATNVLAGGKVTLPAAIDASHLPFGLSQEPITGDFLITRDYVNGSSPNKTIDIYRITSSGSNSYFSVNIDDLGSTATGMLGYFPLSYDPESNHVFLVDGATGKIYEIYPDRILTSRS
jgi:hypothetical protein